MIAVIMNRYLRFPASNRTYEVFDNYFILWPMGGALFEFSSSLDIVARRLCSQYTTYRCYHSSSEAFRAFYRFVNMYLDVSRF